MPKGPADPLLGADTERGGGLPPSDSARAAGQGRDEARGDEARGGGAEGGGGKGVGGKGLRSAHAWVASTNFAEGFPYAVVHSLSEAIFVAMGANLKALGLTSLFHLPWNLKFAWGPLLDHYGTKRRWMLGCELVLCALLVAIALFVSNGATLAVLSVLFVAMGFVAATHDIAIDAYYLAALDDEAQSSFVGYRAAAFRVATLVVAGPIVALGAKVGWGWAVGACLAIMLLLMANHARYLPRVEIAARPLRQVWRLFFRLRVVLVGVGVAGLVFALRDQIELDDVVKWSAVGLAGSLGIALASLPYWQKSLKDSEAPFAVALLSFLEQPKVAVILGFTLCFRLGESFLGKMKMVYLTREAGMAIDTYSWANGTIGVVAMFTATILGGKLIARQGLRAWIWPFVLAQNTLNLLYAAVAYFGIKSQWVLFGVIGFERAGEGLGIAVLMVFLMRTCNPKHKAAHFAFVSALMSVGFTLAGTVSGFLAEELGYANYFLFTFGATLPGMAFIFVLPYLDGRNAPTDA